MKISFNKDSVAKKLAGIKGVVESKSTMPILSHFLLKAEQDKCSIQGTDLELHIKEPIEAKVEEPGVICIPGHKFSEVVKELDGEISLQTEDKDGSWVKVKSKSVNYRIACLPAADFPTWPVLEGEELTIKLNAKRLASILSKTLYAAGESDNRYTLNGILFHVNPEAKTLSFVGTDGNRMALMSIPLGADKEVKAIIPKKHLVELKKFLTIEGDIIIKFGKNNVLFDFGDRQIFSRLIEGTYPNYSQIIPLNNGNKLLVGTEAFLRTLRRVAVMSSKKRCVIIDIKEGEKTSIVSCSEANTGEAQDELPVDYFGGDIRLGFNPDYLLDALAAMESEKVVLNLEGTLTPALLIPEGDTMYKCVVMPVRL